MSEIEKGGSAYIGYDYKELTVERNRLPFYLDGYGSFGWQSEDTQHNTGNKVTVTLRRERKIINKAELTRLQRNFEACMENIVSLENEPARKAGLYSLVTGVLGTGFMAGSVFAVVATPPIIWLCIVLAIPAFFGWICAPMLHRQIHSKIGKQMEPLIEKKYDEIDTLCQNGHKLLYE